MKIPFSYYKIKDVVWIAKDLLGKIIYTNINGKLTSGIISETEAYNGIIDKACHAYNNKRTTRTETMFMNGGYCYVYLCYGVHHLLNIVTSNKNEPKAVLIRGIQPLEGISTMLFRRNKKKFTKSCHKGPGKISISLGISKTMNGTSLNSNKIWLEDHGLFINDNDITITKRIGVDYAEEDAHLPYRFILKDSFN